MADAAAFSSHNQRERTRVYLMEEKAWKSLARFTSE